MAEEKKSPLKEIIQPFIDLSHAPRALWGVNLAYVIEGMVYFGMLGYLAIHFSDFVFQGVEHADEYSHNNVMILTAGITIAMLFLGFVADKWGIRFALVSAFALMLIGRVLMSAAPNVLGLDPARPGVLVGDQVSLHVTALDTKDENKAITDATVIANDRAGGGPGAGLVLDLAAGEGIAPSEELESKLVRLGHAMLVEGEGQEWKVQYGSAPVTAQLLMHTAKELGLRAGATISLDRAYVTKRKKKKEDDSGVLGRITKLLSKWFGDDDPLPESLERGNKDEFIIGFGDDNASAEDRKEPEGEFIIRSHWLEDVVAVDTFPLDLAAGEGIAPDASHQSRIVRLSEAKLVKGEGNEWRVEYGDKPITGQWFNRSPEDLGLCNGAIFSLNRASVTKEEGIEFALRFDWRRDLTVVDASICQATPDSAESVAKQLTLDLSAGEGIALDAVLEERRWGRLKYKDVQLAEATVTGGEGHEWQVQYGRAPVTARLLAESVEDVGLCTGAKISLYRAEVTGEHDQGRGLAIRARWPEDFAAVSTYACEEPPYRTMESAREEALRSDSRWPVTKPNRSAREARRVSIVELRELEDGPVNVVLSDVQVAYVRNGGYSLQSKSDDPAIFVLVTPVWSPLHLVTVGGILLVVVGYGMYQPAAYAAVRQFTTPKTAGMAFAMLYALMNLGGWLPTFAFLLRDDDFAGLGIPGTYWVYTAFTLVALLVTVFILTRKTVADAIATAKAERQAIEQGETKGEEAKSDGQRPEEAGSQGPSVEASGGVPIHLWLLACVTIAAICWRTPVSWRYVVGGALTLGWIVSCLTPPVARWLARHPLADRKFFFFIFALIPVQTLFTYNWLILPQYINRAFEGWIGEYFEIAANANPILIFIAVPIIAAATQKANVYNMMIIGTFVMAAPAFLLALGPHAWTLFTYILIMTIGEAMWQPRFLQYAAEIAPEGRTGVYMGVAQLPWFLTKMLVPFLYSGWMMDRYCPAEGEQNTESMWLIFACIAMCSTVLLVLAKGWIGRDFKTKAD